MNTNFESYRNLFQMSEKREVVRSSTVRNNVIFPIVINTIHYNIVYGNTTHVSTFYALVRSKIIGVRTQDRRSSCSTNKVILSQLVQYNIERNAYCLTWHTYTNINKRMCLVSNLCCVIYLHFTHSDGG